MPKFTIPCFVRVEDPIKRKELIEWLRNVGYRATTSGGATLVIDASIGMVYVGNYSDSEQRTGRIDCSTNIDLFKALAAMNNESDLEQWFIEEGRMFKCQTSKINNYSYHATYTRKATKEQIIDHFKTK